MSLFQLLLHIERTRSQPPFEAQLTPAGVCYGAIAGVLLAACFEYLCLSSSKVESLFCNQKMTVQLPVLRLIGAVFYWLGNLTFTQVKRVRFSSALIISARSITVHCARLLSGQVLVQLQPSRCSFQPDAHVVYRMGTALLRRIKQVRFLPCVFLFETKSTCARSTMDVHPATNGEVVDSNSTGRFLHRSLTQMVRVLPLKQRDPSSILGRSTRVCSIVVMQQAVNLHEEGSIPFRPLFSTVV
jgi:hypothetical protein